MANLKSFVSIAALSHLGSFVSVRKRTEDGDGKFMVSRSGLEVIEFVGAGNNLRGCLDDGEGFVVVSTFLVDGSLAAVNEVSVLLSNLSILRSAHHGSCNKKDILSE